MVSPEDDGAEGDEPGGGEETVVADGSEETVVADGGDQDEIQLFEMDWTAAEVHNAVDVITRGSFWANGPYVDDFEERLAAQAETEHAITFNSGTSALWATLAAHDVGPGDEVIVPSFTFVATANVVAALGATPVFAEIEDERYGLDPADVRARITGDTVAIVPVHYAGCPCLIAELQAIADEHDLMLVEDAAEAQGARQGGQPVGSFGDAGVLSFCQNKVVATGEGGAVVTDDADLARRLELFRSHGRASGEYFSDAGSGEYVDLGHNLRMADIVASVGVAQMDRFDDIVAGRRDVAARYAAGLADVDGVEPPTEPDDARHVFQLYTVTLAPDVDREAVIEGLAERGVASKVYFDPVHLNQYYRAEHGHGPGELPTTEALSSRVLSLPMHPNLSPRDVDRVVDALADVVPGARNGER